MHRGKIPSEGFSSQSIERGDVNSLFIRGSKT